MGLTSVVPRRILLDKPLGNSAKPAPKIRLIRHKPPHPVNAVSPRKIITIAAAVRMGNFSLLGYHQTVINSRGNSGPRNLAML